MLNVFITVLVINLVPALVYYLKESGLVDYNFYLIWLTFATLITLASVILFNKKYINPLKAIQKNLQEMKQGNFSKVMPYELADKNDIVSNLEKEMYLVAESVRELVVNLEKGTLNLYSSGKELEKISDSSAKIAEEVAKTVEQLAQGATSQVGEIENCTANISNIANESQKIDEESKNINDIAESFVSMAIEGKTQIEENLVKIFEIKETTTDVTNQITILSQLNAEIEKIVDLITTISKQTNMLALNASIEAYRAGDMGKGFAVVADEVKSLAAQSSASTEKIKEMIERMQTESEKAVEAAKLSLTKVEDGVSSFQNINTYFEKIFEQSKIIKRESNQINFAIKNLVEKNYDVLNAMNSVSGVTESNAAATEEITASAQEHSAGSNVLKDHANKLLKLARNIAVSSSVFKTDDKPVIFYWSKQFFINNDEIDYHHFKIVSYVNELYQKYLQRRPAHELKSLLVELGEFTAYHFAFEEELMLNHKFPRYNQQVAQHKKLLADLEKFIAQLNSNSAQIDESFLNFLKNWLAKHILDEDMLIGKHINR